MGEGKEDGLRGSGVDKVTLEDLAYTRKAVREHLDDPFAPHNDPMRKDDPWGPWNDPVGREDDLEQRDRDYYGRG